MRADAASSADAVAAFSIAVPMGTSQKASATANNSGVRRDVALHIEIN